MRRCWSVAFMITSSQLSVVLILNLAIRKSEVRLHVAEFGAYCSSNYTLYYPHLGPTTLGLSSGTRRTTLEGVYGSGVKGL
ncbi:hypothetical protein V8E55_007546 [Tylopilus felleus]